MQQPHNPYIELSPAALQVVSSLSAHRLPIDGLKRTPNTRATVKAARAALELQIRDSQRLLEALPELDGAPAAAEDLPVPIGERWFLRQARCDDPERPGVVFVDFTDMPETESYVRRLMRRGLGLTLCDSGRRRFILNGDGVKLYSQLARAAG